MPQKYTLGDYIARESVYVLYDKNRCLYVGDTRKGRAGVASRITNHLSNAANQKKRIGTLHKEINSPTKKRDWFLFWRLEIYTVAECRKKTKKKLSTVKEAQQAMIELLKPSCNAHRK